MLAVPNRFMNDFAFASTAGKQSVENWRKSDVDFAKANGLFLDLESSKK